MDQIINNELIEIDNITCLEESVIVKRMMDYLLPEYLNKKDQINNRALEIVRESRKSISLIKSPIENLLQEYKLNTEEGTVLLCLAEALLRIPDQKTIDRLLEDKFTSTDWKKHTGFDKGIFVNASSWAFLITGNILKRNKFDESSIEENYKSLLKKSSEPVFRSIIRKAVMVLAKQFVFKSKMEEAVKFTKSEKYKNNIFSFDMLGEGARTQEDAEKYFQEYKKSIEFTGDILSNDEDVRYSNGVSIKLSALNSRYERHKYKDLETELIPKLIELGLLAKKKNIQLCIDAEEDKRFILSLKIFKKLIETNELSNWNGLGLALQAYQKRAFYTIDWINKIAIKNNKVIPIRLVKGAYWDSEIKAAQELGLEKYPVFTRKAITDLSWMACAIKMLKYQKNIFPAFATHNAHSIAFIEEVGKNSNFEFQRIHGMADILNDYFNKNLNNNYSKCRIYAPVGNYEDLLPYLMRRLLENGANTSFVNKLNDLKIKIDELISDPIEIVKSYKEYDNPYIPLPNKMFLPNRENSLGTNLFSEKTIAKLENFFSLSNENHNAHSLILNKEKISSNNIKIFSPSSNTKIVGNISYADENTINDALKVSKEYQKKWSSVGIDEKIKIIKNFALLLENNKEDLLKICVNEAGKTINDSYNDLREAIDFCYYYSSEAKKILNKEIIFDGPTGEKNKLIYESKGVIFCISPWNFPIAIFVGQIVAALLCGNTVIAKPAEQTSIISYKIIKLLFDAGLPVNALQLILGEGSKIGEKILQNGCIKGVLFTGSCETAKSIQNYLNKREELVSLTAETGGQNFMIVDSSALTEQVVDDVIESAFNSAGQRCSALRILAIQNEVYDKTIQMLIGATKKIKVGLPERLDTDLGPLIDENAKEKINNHLKKFKNKILFDLPINNDLNGFYVGPKIIELDKLGDIKNEVFGPVLHVYKYKSNELEKLIESINKMNYGLTLGLHSRIDNTINYVFKNANIGNIYINRNITGAVVGVQPFGGRGLSGTGPKAGGPNYLINLLNEKTYSHDMTTSGGNASLFMLPEKK